jgi:hypothetical protein
LVIINNSRFTRVAGFGYFLRDSLNSLNFLRLPFNNLRFRCGLYRLWSRLFSGIFLCYWLITSRLVGGFGRGLFGDCFSFGRRFFRSRFLSWSCLRLNLFSRFILWRFRGRWTFFYWFSSWGFLGSGFFSHWLRGWCFLSSWLFRWCRFFWLVFHWWILRCRVCSWLLDRLLDRHFYRRIHNNFFGRWFLDRLVLGFVRNNNILCSGLRCGLLDDLFVWWLISWCFFRNGVFSSSFLWSWLFFNYFCFGGSFIWFFRYGFDFFGGWLLGGWVISRSFDSCDFFSGCGLFFRLRYIS